MQADRLVEPFGIESPVQVICSVTYRDNHADLSTLIAFRDWLLRAVLSEVPAIALESA